MDQEGYPTAERLNELGISAFVLKYRVYPYLYPTAMVDCRRAICFIKAHAKEFGIDADKLSMLGYSAGGNLAASAHYLFASLPPIEGYEEDEIDKIDPSIASLALIYPELKGERNLLALQFGEQILTSDSYCAQIQKEHDLTRFVRGSKTPLFLVAAQDDGVVDPSNALDMGRAALENHSRVELHLFSEGGHGFGVRQEDFPSMYGLPARRMKGTREWVNLYANWLTLTLEERR